MQNLLGREAERDKRESQDRDDHRAAADAEQAREETDEHAEDGVRDPGNEVGGQAQDLSSFSTARHSAGVTGVIERRLPLRSVRVPVSSRRSRISARPRSRVFFTNFTSTFIQRGSSPFDAGSKYGLFASNFAPSG